MSRRSHTRGASRGWKVYNKGDLAKSMPVKHGTSSQQYEHTKLKKKQKIGPLKTIADLNACFPKTRK